jgi:molybdopterin biosynthesis enzyme MoaB
MSERVSLRCAVYTVSASRTTVDDTSGDLRSNLLGEGHQLVRQAIVRPNLYETRRILGDRIADADADAQVVLLNGDGRS